MPGPLGGASWIAARNTDFSILYFALEGIGYETLGSGLLLFGVATVYAEHGNTTAIIDPAKTAVTVVVSDPDGIAAVKTTDAGGDMVALGSSCVNPIFTLDITRPSVDFPLTLEVADCAEDSTEFVVHLPSVGGTTSFSIGDSSSSTSSLAFLAGGVAAVVAITAGGWYTRRRLMRS